MSSTRALLTIASTIAVLTTLFALSGLYSSPEVPRIAACLAFGVIVGLVTGAVTFRKGPEGKRPPELPPYFPVDIILTIALPIHLFNGVLEAAMDVLSPLAYGLAFGGAMLFIHKHQSPTT
ncbi:MAG: hypothetical protein HY369_01420 [Candidatus Aenigmarchaeota archaeon]|nr:hypothetical protein [Candidatus Aenigmarchaeota archaeon]